MRLFARLRADGSIDTASPRGVQDEFTGKFNNGTGNYQIYFNQVVCDCGPTVSAG